MLLRRRIREPKDQIAFGQVCFLFGLFYFFLGTRIMEGWLSDVLGRLIFSPSFWEGTTYGLAGGLVGVSLVFNLRGLTGLRRREGALRLVLRPHPSVRYVSHVLEHGEDFHRAVAEQGLEGSIAKLRESRYEPGARSRSWLKVKARLEQDFVVIGYEPGKGSHHDLGSLLVATHEDAGWRFAGSSSKAVHDVSLRIKRGEFVTIAGPSGSGKTTLALAMCGLLVGR